MTHRAGYMVTIKPTNRLWERITWAISRLREEQEPRPWVCQSGAPQAHTAPFIYPQSGAIHVSQQLAFFPAKNKIWQFMFLLNRHTYTYKLSRKLPSAKNCYHLGWWWLESKIHRTFSKTTSEMLELSWGLSSWRIHVFNMIHPL